MYLIIEIDVGTSITESQKNFPGFIKYMQLIQVTFVKEQTLAIKR